MQGSHERARRWAIAGGFLAAVLGGGLFVASRAETWVPEENRRLPAPRYLDHPPQYFPPSSAKKGAEP
jgi:hypothetical protein